MTADWGKYQTGGLKLTTLPKRQCRTINLQMHATPAAAAAAALPSNSRLAFSQYGKPKLMSLTCLRIVRLSVRPFVRMSVRRSVHCPFVNPVRSCVH